MLYLYARTQVLIRTIRGLKKSVLELAITRMVTSLACGLYSVQQHCKYALHVVHLLRSVLTDTTRPTRAPHAQMLADKQVLVIQNACDCMLVYTKSSCRLVFTTRSHQV